MIIREPNSICGGYVFASGIEEMQIKSSTFSFASADKGGAVYVANSSLCNSDVFLNCTFISLKVINLYFK
jgi:hypothetical protein